MELLYLYDVVFLVLVVKSEIVVEFLDGEALLSCDSKVKGDGCHRVQWVKHTNGVRSIILTRPKTLTFPDAERVESRPDENGAYSLYLTKLRGSDAGVYSCEIWSGWSCIDVRNTTLRLKECKTLPALKAVQGTSVNLSCPLDETVATQRGATNVSWVMVKPAKTVPVTSERAEVNGWSLSFRAVGEQDSSWYRCKYKLEQAQRCYDVNLQVQGLGQNQGPEIYSRELKEEVDENTIPPQRISGPAAAAVTVVLLAAAVAAALAGFLVHRRRRRSRIRKRNCSRSRQTAAQRHSAGADLHVYWDCDTVGEHSATGRSAASFLLTDCSIYKHVTIDQEIPANPSIFTAAGQ